MKKMDYTVSGRGRHRTITPLTDRAKGRTSEPLEFPDVPEALEFLNEAQAEGFRFAGANLIDRRQKQVRNRYFSAVDGGQFVLCGEDWGPLDTVWEVGDVMPGQKRNTGIEAIIDQILQGDVAKRLDCDLAFILRMRNIAGVN
jgi:hypothetical protein